MEFQKFDKIPRLSRDIVITEKIDGTNGQVYILSYRTYVNSSYESTDSYFEYMTSKAVCKIENKDDKYNPFIMFAGSRKRWLDISSKGDNYGFAKWVKENAEELLKLGEGRHYGEWYGKGIQRNYGLDEKRFALFNIGKYYDSNRKELDIMKATPCPKCCTTVPILYKGEFNTIDIKAILADLKMEGSCIVPGFMNPEGIVIYHTASGQLFKKTLEHDEKPKGR